MPAKPSTVLRVLPRVSAAGAGRLPVEARRAARAALAAAAITAAAPRARAAPGGGHGFVSLDRMSPGSRLEASLGAVVYDRDPDFAGRLDLYAQLAGNRGGGGYAVLPFSFADGYAALGNVELGGMYNSPGRLSMTLRGGLVINTAREGQAARATALAIPARYTDLVLAALGSPWFRFSMSPRWSGRRVFLRGDFGFDVPFPDSDSDTLARANFGLGWAAAGRLSLTAELVNLANLGDLRPGVERYAQQLTFGARVDGSEASGYFGVSVPLDDLVPVHRFTLTAGLQLHF